MASSPAPNVHDALGLSAKGELVSIVGGGGKSALLFALADAPARWVLTTTTRMFAAQISLATIDGSELVLLGADEERGRRGLDLGAMVDHLVAKHEWIEPFSDSDHVARIRVRELVSQPERIEEVIGEIAMGRSILEG